MKANINLQIIFLSVLRVCKLMHSRLLHTPISVFFPSSFSSDEVIRKRLLIDGDGAGDDRRINVLLKSFIKWCHSNVTPEEG